MAPITPKPIDKKRSPALLTAADTSEHSVTHSRHETRYSQVTSRTGEDPFQSPRVPTSTASSASDDSVVSVIHHSNAQVLDSNQSHVNLVDIPGRRPGRPLKIAQNANSQQQQQQPSRRLQPPPKPSLNFKEAAVKRTMQASNTFQRALGFHTAEPYKRPPPVSRGLFDKVRKVWGRGPLDKEDTAVPSERAELTAIQLAVAKKLGPSDLGMAVSGAAKGTHTGEDASKARKVLGLSPLESSRMATPIRSTASASQRELRIVPSMWTGTTYGGGVGVGGGPTAGDEASDKPVSYTPGLAHTLLTWNTTMSNVYNTYKPTDRQMASHPLFSYAPKRPVSRELVSASFYGFEQKKVLALGLGDLKSITYCEVDTFTLDQDKEKTLEGRWAFITIKREKEAPTYKGKGKAKASAKEQDDEAWLVLAWPVSAVTATKEYMELDHADATPAKTASHSSKAESYDPFALDYLPPVRQDTAKKLAELDAATAKLQIKTDEPKATMVRTELTFGKEGGLPLVESHGINAHIVRMFAMAAGHGKGRISMLSPKDD